MWQLSEEGGDAITSLQWNPNPSHQVVAAAVGNVVVLIATGTGERERKLVLDEEAFFMPFIYLLNNSYILSSLCLFVRYHVWLFAP